MKAWQLYSLDKESFFMAYKHMKGCIFYRQEGNEVKFKIVTEVQYCNEVFRDMNLTPVQQ